MKKTILYSLLLAVLAFGLKAIDYRFMVHDLSKEVYIGTIAAIFCALGAWAGRRLTSKPGNAPILQQAEATRIPITPPPSLGLSARELEVLTLIASGHSNQEIADALFLSLNTIKKHSSSLFAKMEVKRRTQAIEKAKRLGII